MRIAVLWTSLSGYLNACLRELAASDGVELFVSHQAPYLDAPFDEDQFAWMKNRFMWRESGELDVLENRLREFDPEILLFSGWSIAAYRRAAKAANKKCLRIMTMDNCWLATPRQRLATWIAPYYLRLIADMVWLPGERQSIFARKLGFGQQDILRGLYCCDQRRIESVHEARISAALPLPRSFLFVGRFACEKGIETLVKGYEMYRANCSDPWPLVCCGAGPLRPLLENRSGIQVEGFLQPEQLLSKFKSAGCLVLPSDFEPWAVVVHEAASAGLLILASENVGAAVHLVQDNYNGYIFGGKDVRGLAKSMVRVSALSDKRINEMSVASHTLSLQFSLGRWVDTLLHVASQSVGIKESDNVNDLGDEMQRSTHVNSLLQSVISG